MEENISFMIILILLIATFSAFINEKILKLSETTGFTILSIAFSLIIVFCLKLSIDHSLFKFINKLSENIKEINFQKIVLNYLIGFLLFATTLHVNVLNLKNIFKNILYLATLGVVISAIVTGYLMHYIFALLNLKISISVCLIFGALIAPTDPITVIGVLKNNSKIPERTKQIILGESLFNDATGVLLITILTMLFINNGFISNDISSINYHEILHVLYQDVVLSIIFSGLVGFLVGKIIKSSKNGTTILMTTLLTAYFVYNTCNIYALSAPLSMVVLGLIVGHYLRKSDFKDNIYNFWEIIEELLNSCLFVLIGLKIITLNISTSGVFIGVIAVFIVMVARYISIIIPSLFLKTKSEKYINVNKKSLLMTLGGVRGGISLALVLSIDSLPNIIVLTTYVVVIASIIIQSYLFEIYCNKIKICWDC